MHRAWIQTVSVWFSASWLCSELLVSRQCHKISGSWSISRSPVTVYFRDLLLAPTTQAKEILNDGGTAAWFLWASTGEADSVDGGILAGTEEHSCHMWVMFSSQAPILQLAVQTCRVQTDSLYQSRLIFMPREVWIYSHLDSVIWGRPERGQLSPWGNTCWLRNNYFLYFMVKVQTRHAWAHSLTSSWTSPGLLWAFSLNQQMCCVIAGFHGHLVVWDDGHWAAPVMVTGMKEVFRSYYNQLN